MMKRFGNVVIMAMIWIFTSCEEEPPILRKAEKPLLDTAYLMGAPSAESKRVWLADITGVKCTNCPEAAEIAYQIYKENAGRVELIALYPTFFPSLTGPWEGYDTLVLQEANEMIAGEPVGIPRGLVDNIVYNGNRFIDRFSWPSVVTERLKESTPINLGVQAKWESSENKGRIELTATANKTYNKPVLFHMAILEDGIIGKQSDSRVPSGYIKDYEFNHVLRKSITSPIGDTLSTGFGVPGYTIEKHYYIAKESKWDVNNLSCLIWVSDAETKEVLQTASAKFKP
ncbi:MAG: Omp28-related outer membrane protein [Bacteroidota bacterium]|nr:Omp28-related outer membrane protein [Bacteroidota bacterium]